MYTLGSSTISNPQSPRPPAYCPPGGSGGPPLLTVSLPSTAPATRTSSLQSTAQPPGDVSWPPPPKKLSSVREAPSSSLSPVNIYVPATAVGTAGTVSQELLQQETLQQAAAISPTSSTATLSPQPSHNLQPSPSPPPAPTTSPASPGGGGSSTSGGENNDRFYKR